MGTETTPASSLFPALGECRKCFMPCGACPDTIRAHLEKAEHNLANLEFCIERRIRLEEALQKIADNAECPLAGTAQSVHRGQFCAHHMALAALGDQV